MARRWRWAGNQNAVTLVAGTSQAVAVLPDTASEKGETITRIVGSVMISLAAVSVVPRRNAAGLILAPSQAGAGSLPSPIADLDANWIWHQWFTMAPIQVAADFQTQVHSVDSRAMRVIGQNQTLFMVSEAAVANTLFHWGMRFGIKMA